jgi:predicted double-glycine peptidase
MAKILILFVITIFAYSNTSFKVEPFSKLKKKGTVLQQYEESCGAAALATVMNIYGKNLDEKSIIEKISKTDMLNFAEMAKISREFDFESAGYKIDEETFNKLKFSVIARIVNRDNFAHFVVVTNFDGDFVAVNDPSFGYYIETKKDFFKWWSSDSKGYILVVLPKGEIQQNIKLSLPNKNLYLR